MKTLSRRLAILAVLALMVPPLRAAEDEAPSIIKRGSDEKVFAEKVSFAIVRAARTSIKATTLEKFEKKNPKDGRTDWYITAGFKGAATGRAYTADIVIHLDTSDKEKWEVLRIEYTDNSKSLVGYNRKNIENLVKKFNMK